MPLVGYTVVALNHSISGKIPNAISNPIPKDLPFDLPSTLRVLRRCTLEIDELPPNHRLQALAAEFDILALRPTNEKSLLGACGCQHCDIISLDLTQRFETHYKMKQLSLAYDLNIMFEIAYAPAILASESNVRRTVISNATQIIRNSRGRGIVLSSGASKAHGCRGPADIVNLAAVWGLGQERGKEAIEKNARSVVVSGAIKRSSWRGVVDIVHGGENVPREGQNTQKRKADALADVTLAKGEPKPMSKSQMKKQRKLERQRQEAEEKKDE